mmetsp:Transcript_20797/g.36491  ORF Transcript_20797/g.36491 Transcript_20797/m.36491 type:complete len:503 (-) Transcript_20797:164-1672(-)
MASFQVEGDLSSVDLELFVREIPKTDLHVHLDGSLRPATLAELAAALGVALPQGGAPVRPHYADLREYLQVFHYTVEVLQRGGAAALERVAFELGEDSFDEGVRHLEVRFSPQMFATLAPDGTNNIQDVLEAVDKGLRRAKQQFEEAEGPDGYGYQYGIISCAMRGHVQEWAPYFREFWKQHEARPPREIYALLAVDVAEATAAAAAAGRCQAVGLDLACTERGFPAKIYAPAFALARRSLLLGATVHAGEDYGPESVWGALADCGAERIGHGFNLFDPSACDGTVADPEGLCARLADFIAHRRIHIEVCLTSNEQTMRKLRGNLDAHSFKTMMERDISCSLCTDNRLVSNTTTSREIIRAIQTFGLTQEQLRKVVIEGFEHAFFPGTYLEKKRFLTRVNLHFSLVEDKFFHPQNTDTSTTHNIHYNKSTTSPETLHEDCESSGSLVAAAQMSKNNNDAAAALADTKYRPNCVVNNRAPADDATPSVFMMVKEKGKEKNVPA